MIFPNEKPRVKLLMKTRGKPLCRKHKCRFVLIGTCLLNTNRRMESYSAVFVALEKNSSTLVCLLASVGR